MKSVCIQCKSEFDSDVSGDFYLCYDCIEGTVCTCDRRYGLHSCPYKADVNDDSETECDCCPYCEQQCADDI